MATEFTYRIEDAKISRSSVSAAEWALLVNNTTDPEGYADEAALYIDADAHIEAEADDDGISWDCPHFTLNDGTKISGGNLYRLLSKATPDASIDERAQASLCVRWHSFGPVGDFTAGGAWRAA